MRRPPPPHFELRPLRLRDASTLARLCSDPGVARMTVRMPSPYQFEDAEQFLASVLSVQTTERVWGVEAQFENGPALIGALGWSPIQHDGQVELGYWLGRPFWGRGVATAACKRVLRRAFDDPSLSRVIAATFKDNPASARVLVKLGFVMSDEQERPCQARGGRVPSAIWTLARARWSALIKGDEETAQ